MKYSVGVDLGSTAIKVVFVQNNTLIWHKAIPTAPGQEALANKVIEEGIRELDISKDDILGVAATGYGKNLMNIADKVIDEVSANALGLHLLSGAAAKVIINIGGQDIKIIQTAHYSAANDLPGLKNCVFRLSFHSPFTIFDYLCIDDC